MFCGLIIKPGQKIKLDSTQGEILHLSQACLSEPKDNGRVYLQAIDNDKAITICSLQKGTVEHANLDLFLSTSTGIQLSIIGKNEVHVSGFYEPEMGDDEFDDNDALMGISDEDDEEIENLDNKNNKKNLKRKLPTKSEESTDEEIEDEEIDSDEADDLDLDELIQDDDEDDEMEGVDDDDDDDDEDDEDEDDDEDEQEEDEQEEDEQEEDEEKHEKSKSTKVPVKNKNKQANTNVQKSKQETNQPPSKKTRVESKSQSKPDQIYEESIVEFLKKNGRTNLAMIGNKIKRPEGVSKKLGSFIAERTDLFKVENNMISLVK